jgi:hypothetical protein
MSREHLLGLAADADRLLAAGVTAAGGDSLRRRGKTLRELGAKVPALVPVADAVERVTGTGKPAPAFLDLLVMTRQLRAGLASTGVEGPLTPLSGGGVWQTPLPQRELQPIYEALTEAGAGREAGVRDAAKRGLFADLRLVTALLEAVEDSHPPVADAAAEEGLPALGVGVLAELCAALNLDGKAPDARRLGAVCRIDPKAGAELCRRALIEGSAALRAEALTRLPEVAGSAESVTEGLKYYKDKSRDVRIAAARALAAGAGEEVLAALLDTLGDKDLDVGDAACQSLVTLRHPQTAERLLAELRHLLTVLRTPAPKKTSAKSEGAKNAPAKVDGKRFAIITRARFVTEALGKRKDGDRAAVARTILPLLTEEELNLGVAATAALAATGPVIPEVMAVLVDCITGGDARPADRAIDVLEEFPPPAQEAAVPALAAFVASCERYWVNRLRALAILTGHADGHPETVLRALRAALADREDLAGYAGLDKVFVSLGRVGPAARPLLPDVFEAIRNSSADTFYPEMDGGSAVSLIDPEGKEAIPELIEILEKGKTESQTIGLIALAAYGPKARKAVHAVERLVGHKHVTVDRLAGQTLAAIRG